MTASVATYPNSPVSSSTKITGGIVLQRFKRPAVLRGVLTQELVSDVFATVLVVGLLAALCMVPA